MKILSVKFKNINSLQGEHEIFFNQPPLSDVGIFAITGPTGAGKTSILDAITLALYGKTARLQKPSEQIITKNTSDCYSEVAFEVKCGSFISHWSVKKTKANGKPQGPRMILFNSDGTPIIDKINDVQKKIQELSGLDFAQFSRSIMLAQNEFAAFLNAADKQRAELLEKITGTEIYSLVSQKAFARAKSERERLNALDEDLNRINIKTDDELQTIKQQINIYIATSQNLKQTIDIIREQLAWTNRIRKLNLDYHDSQKAFDDAKHNYDLIKPDFIKIKTAKLANSFKNDLDRLDSETTKYLQQTEFINSLTKEIQSLSKNSVELETRIVSLSDDFEKAKQRQTDMEIVIDQVIALDSEIKNLNENQSKLNAKLDNLKNLLKRKSTEQQNLKIKMADSEKIIAQKQQWLKDHALDKNLIADIQIIKERLDQLAEIRNNFSKQTKKLKELNSDISDTTKKIELKNQKLQSLKEKISLIENLQLEIRKNIEALTHGNNSYKLDVIALESRLQNIHNLKRIILEFVDMKTEINNLNKDLSAQIPLLNEQELKFQTLENNYKKEEEIKNALDLAVKNELLVAKLTDIRQHLQQNTPCPLCGSLEHPYVTGEKPSQSNSQKALKNQSEKLETIALQQKQLMRSITELKTTIGQKKENIAKIERQSKTKADDFNEICVNSRLTFQIDNPEPISSAITTLETEIKNKKSDLEKIEKLRKSEEQNNEEFQRLQQHHTQTDKDIMLLKSKHEQLTQESNMVNERLNELKRDGQESNEKLQKTLATYNEKSPAFGKETEFIEFLESRIKTYQEASEQETQLQTMIQQQNEKYNILSNEIEGLENQSVLTRNETNENAEQIEIRKKKRHELFSDKNPHDEKQRSQKDIANKETALSEIKKRYQKSEQDRAAKAELLRHTTGDTQKLEMEINEQKRLLEQDIIKAGFKDFQDVRLNMISEEQILQIEQHLKTYEQLILEKKTLMETIQKDLEQEKQKNLTQDSSETIQTKLEEKTNESETVKKALWANEQELAHQDELKKVYDQTLKKQEAQAKECSKWDKLKDLIGSAKGDEFRKFAQGLTLDKLIGLSNQHLEKLNQRYLLTRHNDLNASLSIEIEDTYHLNCIRPTQTLSGGESFVVSLAMALGLSDLATKNQSNQVASLFLDEGFGFLDRQYLDIVLQTLEQLQDKGKMIGVISHIEALKERIPIQIQVKQKTGGISDIKIVSN